MYSTNLAEVFPDDAGWVENVKRCFVDLLEPFQSVDYYQPEQHGSASIKSVLPVLTGAATPIWRFGKAARPAKLRASRATIDARLSAPLPSL